MNTANADLNVTNVRSQQVFGENHNSISIVDESNGLSYINNQILDFPQRVKIANEFMGLESQVFYRKIIFWTKILIGNHKKT